MGMRLHRGRFQHKGWAEARSVLGKKATEQGSFKTGFLGSGTP